MHLIRRVFVSAGAMWLVLFHVTAVGGQTFLHTTLRTPAQGQLTDGLPPYSMPASSNEGVLLEMASRAAVIFVGTVTAVQKPTDELLRGGSGGAVVEVDFHVERSVRGVTTGAIYALREWAGMWRDSARFLPGQRLLMLLHAPGPGGLSSPVDGLDGAIPIRGGGLSPTVELTAKDLQARAETVAGDQVDMRWLQAKALRMLSYADAPTASPGVTSIDPVADPTATASTGAVSVQRANVGDGASDLLSRVLGLLGAVEALSQNMQRASN